MIRILAVAASAAAVQLGEMSQFMSVSQLELEADRAERAIFENWESGMISKISELRSAVTRKMSVLQVAEKKGADPEDSELATMKKQIKGADKTQLVMMRAMLEGMYEKFKSDIGAVNKSQDKNRGKFDKLIAEAEKHKADRMERLKKVGSNQTDDTSDRIMAYWKKMKVMHKKHYHNMIKVSHAGMERIKKTMDAIDAALAGTLTKGQLKAVAGMVPAASTTQPEVVLIQTAVLHLCDDLASDVHSVLKA